MLSWGFATPAEKLRDGKDLAIAPAAFCANLCRTGGAIERSGARKLRGVFRTAVVMRDGLAAAAVAAAAASPDQPQASPESAEQPALQ